ncbi:30S ribosome-binding factor RbfA [Bacteroidota bacterium]
MEESTRQKKVGRLLQRELGTYFQQHTSDYAKGGMITVTAVRVSPDLSIAKTYLSVFAVADKQAIVDSVREQSWQVRKFLGGQVRNQLRIVPELMFYLDDSLDVIERIDDLLKDQ